jgi:hypothetical protein
MSDRSAKTKAQYSQPKLVVYGEFSKLTASGSTLRNEGTGMRSDNLRIP